jgi:hypothetical protein
LDCEIEKAKQNMSMKDMIAAELGSTIPLQSLKNDQKVG